MVKSHDREARRSLGKRSGEPSGNTQPGAPLLKLQGPWYCVGVACRKFDRFAKVHVPPPGNECIPSVEFFVIVPPNRRLWPLLIKKRSSVTLCRTWTFRIGEIWPGPIALIPEPGLSVPSIIGSPSRVKMSPDQFREPVCSTPGVVVGLRLSLRMLKKVLVRPNWSELINVPENRCFSPTVRYWFLESSSSGHAGKLP